MCPAYHYGSASYKYSQDSWTHADPHSVAIFKAGAVTGKFDGDEGVIGRDTLGSHGWSDAHEEQIMRGVVNACMGGDGVERTCARSQLARVRERASGRAGHYTSPLLTRRRDAQGPQSQCRLLRSARTKNKAIVRKSSRLGSCV